MTDSTEREMRRLADLVPRGGAQRWPDPVTYDDVAPLHSDDDPDHVVGQLAHDSEWRPTA